MKINIQNIKDITTTKIKHIKEDKLDFYYRDIIIKYMDYNKNEVRIELNLIDDNKQNLKIKEVIK